MLELPETVYILEFKMFTAQITLDQICAKGYALPYHHPGKPITLLGIAFDEEKRNLADWKEERVVV